MQDICGWLAFKSFKCLGMQPSWEDAYQAYKKPGVGSPAPYKMGAVVNVYNTTTQEVETGRSGLEGRPWLCREFKTSLA